MHRKEIPLNKTTRLLYWAMFHLLEDNTFEEITVNDICKQALISRSTFYSYFQDKYDLVIFCLEQERERLGIIKGVNVKENITAYLSQIKEKGKAYKNLFLGQANRELNRMITKHFQQAVNYNLEQIIDDEEKLEVYSVLFTTGLSGTIMWWIQNDFFLEPEVLANYQYKALSELFEVHDKEL